MYGYNAANDLGLASAFAADAPDMLDFGSLEPLVRFMQETPADKLMSGLAAKLKSGTDLRRLTAAGALARQLLAQFQIQVIGYVVELGGIKLAVPDIPIDERRKIRDASEIYSLDPALGKRGSGGIFARKAGLAGLTSPDDFAAPAVTVCV